MRETRVDKSLMNRPFIVEMYLRLSPRAIGVGGSEPDPFFGVLLACLTAVLDNAKPTGNHDFSLMC